MKTVIARKLQCGALILTGVLGHPRVASAEQPVTASSGVPSTAGKADSASSEEQLARAKKLFAEGQALMEQRQWLAAAEKFRAAAVIRNTPGLRYHTAFCLERGGKWGEALSEYQATRELLKDEPAPDVEELLEPAIKRIQTDGPRLTVVFTEPLLAPTLEIDRAAVASWKPGEPLLLDPGTHEIRITAAGRRPLSTTLKAEARGRVTLVAAFPRPPAEPLVGDEAATIEPPGWRPVAVVGGAAFAAIGLGVGVWGLLERGSASEDVGRYRAEVDAQTTTMEGACSGATGALEGPCNGLRDALDDRDRATGFAIGGFVAAGLGAATSITTLLLWPDKPSVEVSGVATPGFSGLSVAGQL